MVDSAQLAVRRIPTFFLALLTVGSALCNPTNAIAQSGRVHYSSTSIKHKGVTPLAAPTLTGMRIYWFSASSNGFGSPPISMISTSATGAQTDTAGNVYVLTDANGNFDISAENACPSPITPMYMLATQGDPAGTGQNNPYAALAVVIPAACGNNNWSVDITQTTTVATAFALSSFATVSTDSFATNSGSLAALQSAANYAGTLINSSNAVIPSGSAWETTLNTLADIIEPCVNSASACPALFTATTPPGGVAPTDTFQAALDIALNPNLNLTSLFNALPANPDFSPILSSVPASWVLPGSSIQITGITPQPAPVGTTITVGGSGFGATQGSSTLVINGVEASITSWSDTAIVAVVPSGAGSTGAVQVFEGDLSSNNFPFDIAPLIVPVITGFSLPEGPPQMGFVIQGSGFGSFQGLSTVTLSGVPMSVLAWSSSAITVQVPSGAVSGNVVVTVGLGNSSGGAGFTVTDPFGCTVQ